MDCNWGDGKRYTIENRVAALIWDKADFNPKIRNKEGHYIIIKQSIHQENITAITICALNIGTPNYINQVLTDLSGEIDSITIILGDFKTIVIWVGRSSRQNQ